MAIIPSGQKFHTVPAGVDTADRGSAKSNADRDIYTMQDILDTTASGGGGAIGEDVSFIVREDPYSSIGDHEGTVLTIAPVGALAQAHYWDGTGWVLANASAAASADGLLCLGTSAAGDALVEGIMQIGSAPGSAGDVLYLSTINGTLTATPPSGSGEIVRVVGYNLGGNRVYFKPSADFIEIA
jgi:hypothetical protein